MYYRAMAGSIEGPRQVLDPMTLSPEQSVAIFIAILGLVSLSSGFSLIVVMVLYIEREFVLYIDGFVLIVEGFGLFFLILFWCVSRPQLI